MMTDARVKVRKLRLPKLTRIEKLTRGLLSTRDVNAIFTVKEIKGKGRGVFLRSAVLRKDSFVLEYEGDIISESEAQIRERIYANNNEGCYIMSFSFQRAKLAIDATRKFDSVARFLNHSREPNIRFHPPFMIDLNGGLPRIASYALRDIYRGEEIVIDYGVRDGHITWLRNREIGFVADVDSESSDDSDCSSSHATHPGFRISKRSTLPECFASCSSDVTISEGPTPTRAGMHVSKSKAIQRDSDNMAFGRGEWGVRFTSLVPGGRLNSYFAGFENIDVPAKILKCLEVTSEMKCQGSDSESVVCLSTSSSGSSRMSVRTSASTRKIGFSKCSSGNMDRALSIELPSNEAPDSIHKVLEWQKTSPLPDSTLNIQIVGIQSLSDFSHVERYTNSEHSSSCRQQSSSAFQPQEIPASSHSHPAAQPNTNLHTNNQTHHPSGTFSSHTSSPTSKQNENSVVTVDISESDDTSEISSLSSFSVKIITPLRQPPEPESAAGREAVVEPADVCVVSDDECVPETPVSEIEMQKAETASVGKIACDENDDSSSECQIILTESPKSLPGTVELARNLPAKRAIGFSSPSAQLQVAVIEPFVSPGIRVVSSKEVVAMTDSEIEQLRRIFNKHIVSNKASQKEVSHAINTNWDVFSVLIQRGITLKQIRNIFNSFLKPKR